MSDHLLTQRLRGACRRLIEEHFPREVDLFDHVWEAFFTVLGCESIEDIAVVPAWTTNGAPILHLGASDEGVGLDLDLLPVLSCLVGAAAVLHRQVRSRRQLTNIDIQDALDNETQRINTPHVKGLLLRHGTRLLAELFGVPDRLVGIDSITFGANNQYWVEWCDLAPTDLQEADTRTGYFEKAKAVEEFEPRAEQFALYIDETKKDLLVHKPVRTSGPTRLTIPWVSFEPRYRRFLGLILGALRLKSSISYQKVLNKALENHGRYSPAYHSDLLRQLKARLNPQLGMIVNEILRANRGQQQYEIKRPITYCWLRPQREHSMLF